MTPTTNPVNEYVQNHEKRFLEELFHLLRIPSVSADPKFSEDVFEAAKYVAQQLEEAGADEVEVCPTNGYPVVFGQKMVDPKLPTVVVYGHYDVQPADPYELWKTPPFEPTVKDEKIFARGACDDKGQMFMHIKAFELMNRTNSLHCNVKFMIEGEEEVGSANLEEFLEANKERLKGDVILVSDTSMFANDVPSITVGLRGLSYVEVEVTGPNHDLHSGVYGGAVGNPANILAKMIASLQDENNKITIPGFYDKVRELSAEERRKMNEIPFDLEQYKQYLEIDDVYGEAGYNTYERCTIRPTLDVNGIWGGYTGEGAKTVLPSKAHAKISMRLVPNQDSSEITRLFEEHFKKIAPDAVKVSVVPHHGGEPVITPTDSVEYKAAEQAFTDTFGKEPIPMYSGGSIPIVSLFEKVLGMKTVLMGFGLDSDAIHSPNEHYGLFNFYQGIRTIPRFYAHYAELKQQ